MEEKSLTTITSTNTQPITSTVCQNRTLQPVHKTHTRRCHKTSSSNQHVPTPDQHTNTDNSRLLSTLDHHVLRDTTNRLPHNIHPNCPASHLVQQTTSLSQLSTHSGLTMHTQSSLSMHHHGLHTIVPQDMYELNNNSPQVSCSVARRKAIGSNRYHPWRNKTLQPIRGY